MACKHNDGPACATCEIAQLRADLVRVTEESEGWKRAAESQNRQWSAKCTELTEARAETARLRERVTSIARKWHTFGNRTARQFADEILQALTSDPEPTT